MPQTQMNPLSEYQQSFVDKFLNPSSERTHLLVAPPGFGFGSCIVEIVSRLLRERPEARVLILTERSVLVQQWIRRFDDAALSARSLEGSRLNLRGLAWSEHRAEITWPQSSIVMMLTGSLERFNDVRASMFQTPWDLTVWDSFSPSPSKILLLRALGKAQNFKKILTTSHHRDLDVRDLIPGMHQTAWDWNLLLSSSSESPRAPITRVILTYQRTPEEMALRAQLEEFAKTASVDGLASNLGSGLIRAVDSSPLALRERLRRFHPSKASIAVGEISAEELLEPQDLDDEEQDGPDQSTVRRMQYVNEVRRIQEVLDDLPVDSKLEAMLKYIDNQGANQSHIIIWCRFAATALYLKSALTDSDREVFLIVAGEQHTERLSVLEEFGEKGGFLVATSAAMQGLECSADSIILYDPFPYAPMKALSVLLRRVGEGKPVQIVSLADDSGATTSAHDIIEAL